MMGSLWMGVNGSLRHKRDGDNYCLHRDGCPTLFPCITPKTKASLSENDNDWWLSVENSDSGGWCCAPASFKAGKSSLGGVFMACSTTCKWCWYHLSSLTSGSMLLSWQQHQTNKVLRSLHVSVVFFFLLCMATQRRCFLQVAPWLDPYCTPATVVWMVSSQTVDQDIRFFSYRDDNFVMARSSVCSNSPNDLASVPAVFRDQEKQNKTNNNNNGS